MKRNVIYVEWKGLMVEMKATFVYIFGKNKSNLSGHKSNFYRIRGNVLLSQSNILYWDKIEYFRECKRQFYHGCMSTTACCSLQTCDNTRWEQAGRKSQKWSVYFGLGGELASRDQVASEVLLEGKGNQGSLLPRKGEEGREWQDCCLTRATLLLLSNIGEPCGTNCEARLERKVEEIGGGLRCRREPWGVHSWEGVRQPPFNGLPIGES